MVSGRWSTYSYALHLIEQRERSLFRRPRCEPAHPRAHALHAAEQMLRGRRGGRGAALHRAASGSAGVRRGLAWLSLVATTPASDSSPVRADHPAGNGLHFRNLGPSDSSSTVSLAATPTVEVMAMVHGEEGGFWRGALGQEHAGGVEKGLAARGEELAAIVQVGAEPAASLAGFRDDDEKGARHRTPPQQEGAVPATGQNTLRLLKCALSAPSQRKPLESHDLVTTPRVHHAARWRGGVAARGARAAGGQAAVYRFCGLRRVGLAAVDGSFCSATARPRLDRGSNHCDRVSLFGRSPRSRCRVRG